MRPRPRSRKNPIRIVPAEDLAREVAAIRAAGGEPAAIISGPREWRAVRVQAEAKAHLDWWPGDDETFDRVAVLVQTRFEWPRVIATQADLEDVLLGRE